MNAENTTQAPAELLPVRMLNEFVYCPRLFYFEHVEGVFLHNADTLKGKQVHQRVDGGKGALAKPAEAKDEAAAPEEPAETIHARSVSLASERLGVTAKLDLVEVEAVGPTGAAGRVCPVDYKVGSPREGENGPEIWDADRMQLGLQCLILRDNGYTCEAGIIYYRGTRQRVPLALTPELEAWIIERIAAARACRLGPLPPPLEDSPKCPRCSLAPICLPDETRLLREGPTTPDEEAPERPYQSAFAFDAAFAPARPAPALTPGECAPGEQPKQPRRLIAPRADTKPLYLSSPGLFVGKKAELVVVKDKGETVQEVRMLDLDHVAIFGSATLSTALLQTLCEKDIPVTYFSMGGWFYGLTRGHSLKNVFTRIEQFGVAAQPTAALRFARGFVHGKIRNQRTLLRRNHLSPPEGTLVRLKHLAEAVLGAETLGELLGLEGTAAALYYADFAGMIKLAEPGTQADPDQAFFSFDFHGRNRRPPRDAVNALLSLAYSLLARDCTVATQAVGLDPYVGFMHQPRFGRPALALDLMEEFRPLVADSVVITAINNRLISPTDFVRAGDSVNLSPEGRKRFLEAYERRMAATIAHPVFEYQVSYRRALELQARILAKALTGDIEAYQPFTTR